VRLTTPKQPVGAPRPPGAPTTTPPPPVDGNRGSLGRAVGSLCSGTTEAASDVLDMLTRIGTRGGLTEPELPVPLPGSRTLPVPLLVVIAVDQSGSTATTDPNKESEQACLLVCDWLTQHSQNREDGLGLVRFADHAAALPPVRVDRAREALEQEFRHGASVGGGTQLTPAVTQLCQLLPGPRQERRIALLITDGQVAELGEQLRTLIGRLRVDADAVYLLALDHDGAWSSATHRRYQSLGLTDVIPISRISSRRLACAIANVFAHEAGLTTS